ncbi:hypothetical protein NHX12_027358 [Muraenolepis orangiensis]|uniref:Tyrosine-protein phosphatase non-receptor type 13 n=1 Tax=Muraenolepis orangiensis TaxID=630683 RepID=A0A9Q0EEP3_9TELE|nr:hypothetical protein NHX12_027358 [Muraenolepis orangiensis]
MHVSLAEALEVRGGPLQEEEVWAVLSQSAESLHELFHKDPAAMGFIISPWSLLLMPSGNITFTDENVTQQDLRAFTAPEVLEGIPLASVSDMEKMHMYSLGMTLFWGPMKLGEHLNSLLLNMCDDITLSRMSVRTVMDVCSKHIRSSTCDPPFSYVRKLVRLLDGLLTDRESLPERSKEIRERLRGKGLPSGRGAASRVLERYRVRTQEQASLNRGLSRSMGSLPIQDPLSPDETYPLQYPPSDYASPLQDPRHPRHRRQASESTVADLYSGPAGHQLLQHQLSQPHLHSFQPQQLRPRPVELDQRSLRYLGLPRKTWASSVDLARIDPDALRFGALEDARRGSSALSTQSVGRRRAAEAPRLPPPTPLAASTELRYSDGRGLRPDQGEAEEAADPLHTHQRYHSDYSSSSESPSVASSDPEYRQAKKPEEVVRRFGSQAALGSDNDILSLSSHNLYRHRLYDGAVSDEGLAGAELLLRSQEEEVQRLQAHLAHRLSRANLYLPDELSPASRASMADIQADPFNTTAHSQRKAKSFYGPEFVKMTGEPCVSLTVPSSIMKRGKAEEVQRKVRVVLLNGQRLELGCDLKAVCKDVLDMVVAHVGLVEHHLFGLAHLKDNEFFFVEPDAKLTKVAPEGWKEEPKKKKSDVPFNLFLRIKFFLDDVGFIEHVMTKHQYYLQMRKDILEERVRCDTDSAVLLASLALQAEFSDYQTELHGKTYFRLEHYLPVSILDKVEQSAIKEKLPRLHSAYYGVPESQAQLEFLKVSQRLTEYGVHFHRVLPEKRSQTGIMLGVYSKGVLIFEVLNGNRTPVLRFPWRDTKKISFTKKKICLQNTSDGIKHLFQTDSNKTCQYLLQLCSDQHKFHLQMKARQDNRELQELENSPLGGMQYSLDPQGESLSRAVSPLSLTPSSGGSTRSNPEPFSKRISYSEAALNKALTDGRSHHNLGQLPESPEHRAAIAALGSDTDSMSNSGGTRQQDIAFGPPGASSSSSPLWGSGRFQKESDASSAEDAAGQAYVVGVSRHGSSERSATSLTVNESLKKKLTTLPSPEREIKTVHLKKDVKYGLGFQVVGGEICGRKDLGTIVSSITPGGPADLSSCLKPGDRLLSVNSVSLEGVPHATAVSVLQNAPDDITLVVSQPKERLYEGSPPGYGSYRAAPSVKVPPAIQRHELDFDSSSEELDSRASSTTAIKNAKAPTAATNGILRNPDKAEAPAITVAVGQPTQNRQQRPEVPPSPAVPEALPPALPPKTRKAKVPEVPVVTENSDWGDSDMDEDTCSSGPENRGLRKDAYGGSAEHLSAKGPGVSSLRPGELFDVELSKQDSGLGISVTVLFGKGGVNTTVRHGGVYIKAVIPNGAAAVDGRIQKGDRVVASVHLLLEKGQPPADSLHSPLTQRSTNTSPPEARAQPKAKPPYGFVTDDNVFDVRLLKNTSGLGFSFSREEWVPGEPPGSTSMVRVKKLFPGQPAAESGLVRVGDVILRVNHTSLKGLSQHEVISALRGAGQEVALHLCRPAPGFLPEMDDSSIPAQPSPTPRLARTPSPRSRLARTPSPRSRPARTPSPSLEDTTGGQGRVQEALDRLLLKSPGRPEHSRLEAWDHSIYKTPSGTLGRGRYESPGPLDDSAHSGFYSPNQSMDRGSFSSHRLASPTSAERDSPPQPMVSSPTAPSPDPLPPPLPLPLNLMVPGNGQDTDELVPEENSTQLDQFRIISLLCVEAKVFFSAVSKRLCTYLAENTYIDSSVQKGGISGMPGCLEHTGVVTQLIREARENKGNLSVLWLDLENAFGSIPHKLVQFTLTKHHVPSRCRDLIADYYSNFRMRVSSGAITSSWHKVEIGIITGCTISVTLFSLAMNMLTKSAEPECRGPRTNSGQRQPPIRAFMDDLTVMTGSVPGCRWILKGLEELVEWARMRFKPAKSRSMVLRKGKVVDKFRFNADTAIPPISEKPVKSLGKVFDCSLRDTTSIQSTCTELDGWLKSVDNSGLPGKFKAWVYQHGILPRILWPLLVYAVPISTVETLERREVELQVSLVKSEKGSLGFTLTKGTDQSCYIHDIIQDPARGDGRLRSGDRMITVNNANVSGMGHTEVVNLVRAAPAVVDLLVGRVLETPRCPVDAHLLPDICFSGDAAEELGLVLDGGSDSPYGVLFVRDVLPGSLASAEGSLRPLDLVHYINGAPTQELTLGESRRLLELSLGDLALKATRDGKPVSPGLQKTVSFLNNNEQIIKLQLEKPPAGGLGFSVIGGERGIFVKSVTPGGEAEASGKLQIGDRLLRVNEELMTGVSHSKAVTTIRRAKGLVQLVVSRPPEHHPGPYPGYLPVQSDKCNGNADVSEDSGVKTKMGTPRSDLRPGNIPPLPPIDYDVDGAEDRRGSEQTAELSEDTDCDGSSLPEDSPESSRKAEWKEECVDDSMNENYLQMSADPPEEDDITWGSEELPIEDMKRRDDGPIIGEDELTSLPLVKVVPDGQYTGTQLNTVVRMTRGLLEQKVPLQEFENLQNLQPLDDCLIGQTMENRKKNRYKNIVPFDTTRVTLGQDGGYINANFIHMAVKDESYSFIACQGPLPTTLGDFWQMVWEQKSNVIAMMTQEVEGGKVKCQRYWPDTPGTSEMVDGRLQVTLVKDQYLDNFVIRFIEVKDVQTNEIQRVTHLNYTGWPDHGTPSQPEQLLTFISYMRHIHQSGPVVTHCSAGIGRSGTLICIDVVLGLISKDADFDISDVVRNMRLQRQGMVQTEEQYIFCYQVILYVLRCLQAEEKISG